MALTLEAPLPAILAVGLFVLWAVSEGTTHLLGLFQPKGATRQRAALGWLQGAYAGCLVIGLVDAFVVRATTWIPSAMSYSGAALTLVGIAVRIIARVQLGKNFSAYVQTSSEHRLVTTGLYRRVRHPAYSGFALMLVGFPVAFGSVAALTVAMAIGLPALLSRITAEEAALAEWFGDEYREYQRHSGRLIPRGR